MCTVLLHQLLEPTHAGQNYSYHLSAENINNGHLVSIFSTIPLIPICNSPIRKKRQFLKASLTNDAAKLLPFLTITDCYYHTTLDVLKKCYDSPRMIARAHVQSIFDLPRQRKKPEKINWMCVSKNISYVRKHLACQLNNMTFFSISSSANV